MIPKDPKRLGMLIFIGLFVAFVLGLIFYNSANSTETPVDDSHAKHKVGQQMRLFAFCEAEEDGSPPAGMAKVEEAMSNNVNATYVDVMQDTESKCTDVRFLGARPLPVVLVAPGEAKMLYGHCVIFWAARHENLGLLYTWLPCADGYKPMVKPRPKPEQHSEAVWERPLLVSDPTPSPDAAKDLSVKTCSGLASLKVAYKIVFPAAELIVLEGSRAIDYLNSFNTFGRKSRFRGTVLLLTKLPTGVVLLVPIENGRGCDRAVVGPKLHKIILSKLARGRI